MTFHVKRPVLQGTPRRRTRCRLSRYSVAVCPRWMPGAHVTLGTNPQSFHSRTATLATGRWEYVTVNSGHSSSHFLRIADRPRAVPMRPTGDLSPVRWSVASTVHLSEHGWAETQASVRGRPICQHGRWRAEVWNHVAHCTDGPAGLRSAHREPRTPCWARGHLSRVHRP